MSEQATGSLRFRGRVEHLSGQAIIRLPEDISRQLPSRGMLYARVAAPSQAFELPLEPDGLGGHWLPWPGSQDADQFELMLTEDWPAPELPEDLRQALSASGLADTFDSLTVKARWAWLRWIRATAVPATRQKRIHVAIDKLSRGDRRPCCFNAASCTVPALSKTGQLLPPQA